MYYVCAPTVNLWWHVCKSYLDIICSDIRSIAWRLVWAGHWFGLLQMIYADLRITMSIITGLMPRSM